MRFISPKTDFAFKKIFGSEENKIVLISFLNGCSTKGSPKLKIWKSSIPMCSRAFGG